MPRSRSTPAPLYSRTHNALLDLLRELPADRPLPGGDELVRRCEASPSTLYKITRALREAGVLASRQRQLYRARPVRKKDYLPTGEFVSKRESVERQIIAMLVNGELEAGDTFSELQLARRFDVATVTVREALASLDHIGILEKEARRQWKVVAIDAGFIHDLMEVRQLIELHALDRFLRSRPHPRHLEPFQPMLEANQNLQRERSPSAEAFFHWDEALHRQILQASGNRQLRKLYPFFYFPLQLQLRSAAFDRETMRLGLQQHIDLLQAILAQDRRRARNLLQQHLQTAEQTLLRLIDGKGEVPRVE